MSGRSFFDRLADASAEAAYDGDIALAEQMGRRELRRMRESKEREYRGALLAEKLHEEERDGLLAFRLSELEKKKEGVRQAAAHSQSEADADLARRLSTKWERTDLRAAHRSDKAKRRIAARDEKIAKKLQRSAVGEFERNKIIRNMERCWTAPKLMVSDHDDGICIRVRLPSLLCADVSLRIDPVAVVVVRAQPKKMVYLKTAQDLGANIQIPDAIRFSIDLNIVGEAAFAKGVPSYTVSHTYNAETLRIFLRSLCIAK